jgi:hypothetical protein
MFVIAPVLQFATQYGRHNAGKAKEEKENFHV